MSIRHQHYLALTASALVAGVLAIGTAQAADPTRIRDASPTRTHDLSGNVSKARAMQSEKAAPGTDMKGIGSETAPAVHPTEQDRKAGGAFRTSGSDSGLSTPIGTTNIVRSEIPTVPGDSVAQLPPAAPGQALRGDY